MDDQNINDLAVGLAELETIPNGSLASKDPDNQMTLTNLLLLRLPRELRDQIYEHVVSNHTHDKLIRLHLYPRRDDDKSNNRSVRHLNTGLPKLYHAFPLLHVEIAEAFYKSHSLRFTLGGKLRNCTWNEDMQRWETPRRRYNGVIRKLTVPSIPLMPPTTLDFYSTVHKWICLHGPALHQLRHIQISLQTWYYWMPPRPPRPHISRADVRRGETEEIIQRWEAACAKRRNGSDVCHDILLDFSWDVRSGLAVSIVSAEAVMWSYHRCEEKCKCDVALVLQDRLSRPDAMADGLCQERMEQVGRYGPLLAFMLQFSGAVRLSPYIYRRRAVNEERVDDSKRMMCCACGRESWLFSF